MRFSQSIWGLRACRPLKKARLAIVITFSSIHNAATRSFNSIRSSAELIDFAYRAEECPSDLKLTEWYQLWELAFGCFSKKELLQLLSALCYSAKSGKTPESHHLKMISRYCATSGLSHMLVKALLDAPSSLDNGYFYRIARPGGKEIPSSHMNNFSELKGSGYIRMQKLNRGAFERLQGMISATPGNEWCDRGTIYHLSKEYSLAELYQVVDTPLLATLLSEYLGTAYLARVDAWDTWAAEEDRVLEEDAAQAFHFDLDSIGFLKLFIYMTDVSLKDGPHESVLGTHRVLKKPDSLLRHGYARLSDTEVDRFHAHQRQVFEGEPGVGILADTRAWHKGRPVKGEHYRRMVCYLFITHPFHFQIEKNG